MSSQDNFIWMYREKLNKSKDEFNIPLKEQLFYCKRYLIQLRKLFLHNKKFCHQLNTEKLTKETMLVINYIKVLKSQLTIKDYNH